MFENDTTWNYTVPNLGLDDYLPAEQYRDTEQPCVNEVTPNASVFPPNSSVPWQPRGPPGPDANTDVITEKTRIPEDIFAAGPHIHHPRKKTKTSPGKVHDGQISLACPFQRLDAHKYHRCSKYILRRIKDVKQHIYRCHMQPEYYCALCFNVFESALERDEHIRRAGCNKRPVPWFHGVSDEQRRRLGQKASSTLSVEAQWFEIWGLLFPEQKRPESVWVGSPFEEAVFALRSVWKNAGTRILEDVLGSSESDGFQPALLDRVVNSLFDCLEAESASSPEDNDTLSPARSVDSHDQGPM